MVDIPTATRESVDPHLTLADVPLYNHQRQAIELTRDRNGRCGLFMDMGTGKTRVALSYLWESGVDRGLIVCPLSAVGVWQREANGIGYPVRLANLSMLENTKSRADTVKRAAPPVVYLVNYESYWREPLRTALLKWAPQAIILDEAHRIKHRSAKQSRMAHLLGDRAAGGIKLALTGTPVTNGLEDLWSMYRFIDPAVFGTWTEFALAYLRFGGYMNREIKSYANTETARALLAKSSFQVAKEDCLDLPPRTDVIVPVTLDPGTRRIYEELRKQGIVELGRKGDTGNPADGMVVTRIVLTLILRLQQITGGFVTDELKAIHNLSDEKVSTTVELIQDARASGQRVVVFARFLHDLDKLEAALADMRPRVARIDGSVSSTARTRIQDALHAGSLDVVLCQIRTGSVAMDFTPASVGIFYSTGFGADDFHQARDRLYRIGQKKPVTYYHLSGSAIDEKIFDALRHKANIAREVTSLRYAISLLEEQS